MGNQSIHYLLLIVNILREHIEETCEKFGNSANGKLVVRNFLYDANHKLLFCRNAKVWRWSPWGKSLLKYTNRLEQQLCCHIFSISRRRILKQNKVGGNQAGNYIIMCQKYSKSGWKKMISGQFIQKINQMLQFFRAGN